MEEMNNNQTERNSKRRYSSIPFVIITLLLMLASLAGGYVLGARGTGSAAIPQVTGGSSKSDWSKLDYIKNAINTYYDGEIDSQKELEGAVKGLVNSLDDPYSQFYNQKEFAALNEQGSGKFIGIGIQVGTKDGNIIVIAPIDGGPAKEAGMMSGDIIYKIDGKVYSGSELDDAVSHMRGEEGKSVDIIVKRGDKEIPFTIVRREINMSPVKSEMLTDTIGMITLSQFTKDCDVEFKQALDDLKSKGAKGYVVDLRGNPGGYLSESVRIASNFIEKDKVVVSTIDKNKKKIEDKSVGGDYIGVPLAVLINKGSASASEVVSGALKDYKAAVLVGEQSFGKGIVQQIFELPGGEGLKLTVAAYYSPNGTNIHKIGITPDEVVAFPEDLTQENYTKDKDPQLQKAIEIVKSKIQ